MKIKLQCNIKQILKTKGSNIDECAKRTGYQKNTISNYANNHVKQISIAFLLKFMEAYNIPFHSVYTTIWQLGVEDYNEQGVQLNAKEDVL